MARLSISKIKKNKVGRPRIDSIPLMVRVRLVQVEAIDAWIAGQPDVPSRPEAIRRLVDLGLSSARPLEAPSKKSLSKSSALAAEQIDRLQRGAEETPEQQASRKRRLLKGPKEFRDLRTAPKAK